MIVMGTKEIIEYLEYYQRWRRGADIPQPDPKELGKVIDYTIECLKNNIK